MALPAIAAAAARGTAVIGRGLGRVSRALPGMKGPGPQPEEGAPAEAEEEGEEEAEETQAKQQEEKFQPSLVRKEF